MLENVARHAHTEQAITVALGRSALSQWAAFGAAAAFMLVLGGASPVLASPSAAKTAREYNRQARQLFSLGYFEAAAALYDKAYRLAPAPAFLLNLGHCHKRMKGEKHLKKAVFYFKSYLANAPSSVARKAVDVEIKKLELYLARIKRERSRPPPIYKRWWFWTAIGAAVTGAAVGTTVALLPEGQPAVRGSAAPGFWQMP